MKSRAFKKVLSVICVLSMLLSVCTVSLVSISSAAEAEYTLNANGNVQVTKFNEGAALPSYSSGISGVEFLGWYDKTFKTKYTTAGAEKNLYAKFTSNVYSFDYGNEVWDPNADTKNTVFEQHYKLVNDPKNPSNKCYQVLGYGGSFGIAPTAYPGINEGFKPQPDVKYVVEFDYISIGTNLTFGSTINSKDYTSIDGGMNTNTSSGHVEKYNNGAVEFEEATEWTRASITFKNTAAQLEYAPYFEFRVKPRAAGEVYIDNIIITAVDEQEYSFYNGGSVEKKVMAPGSELPSIPGAYFMGWYDATYTVKYEVVPASNTKLYARFSKVTYNFEGDETCIYDPNDTFDTAGGFKFEKYPNANNTALAVTLNGNNSVALSPNKDIDIGTNLVNGKRYIIDLKYAVPSLASGKNVKITVGAREDATIGVANATAVAALGTIDVTAATTGFTSGKFDFVASGFTDDSSLVIEVATDDNTTVYIDDVVVAPYVAPVSDKDFVMTFDKGFKWSEDDANDYTVSSGNPYVNRGEIVEYETGKYAFRVKQFRAKDANVYFTIDNGTEQFKIINYGLYTVEFDYKIENNITEGAKIGIVYVDPTGNRNKYSIVTVIDEFGAEYEDGWIRASYTFGTELLGIENYTSLGLFVFNPTHVPEYNLDTGAHLATSVLFKDIVVKTHATVSEMGMIRFDSMGGTSCETIIGEATKPVYGLESPQKYGYVFKGWKYDTTDAYGNTVTVDLKEGSAMPYFVTDAYAVWELAKGAVEIEFRSNVDEYDANTPILVAYPGEAIRSFPTVAPTAAGQKFVGWYLDRTFKTKLDPNKAPNKSVTAYAKWETQGEIIDFESYPSGFFTSAGVGNMSRASDRFSIETLKDGNKVLYYDFSRGSNQTATSGVSSIILHNGKRFMTAIEGMEYTITFKYKVIESSGNGVFGTILSSKNGTWVNRHQQGGSINYGAPSTEWKEATMSFISVFNNKEENSAGNNNCISFGLSDVSKVYVDDIMVKGPVNYMNIYGSAIMFNTNGGNKIEPISGDVGDKVDLPKPRKAGYKFDGWYLDAALTVPYTATTFGTEELLLYAKWKLGEFSEGYEDFPAAIAQLGVAGAYSFYNDKVAGFDASNVYEGTTSLFRSGITAGKKSFTLMRTQDYALTIGDTYTLTFYVKPTSVTDASGTISLLGMATPTAINQGAVDGVIKTVGELKEGEWNKVTYTFTAKTQFIAIMSTAGNDMYFDAVTVKLNGYTPDNGDSSVSTGVILAIVIISAGALLITGKKVFSK